MLERCHFSKLIQTQAKKYGERTAITYRDYDINAWKSISWNSFEQRVNAAAIAMLKMGVKVQENIGVFSQNKPECLITDFAAYGIRAVTIPFYATSSAAQIKYMVNDASVRIVFVGEQEQYDTAFSIISICPTLEKIIIFDPKVKKNEKDHLSIYFLDFLKEGVDNSQDEERAKRLAAANEKDIANILYTSGTTGNSKGVILTHEMYNEALRVNDRVLHLSEEDVFLNFLPFTHVFERAWSYLGLAEGAVQAVNLRPLDVQQSLREVHPTCMSTVPRFWEKVYNGVLDKINNGSPVERVLINDALKVGCELWEKYTSKNLRPPFWLKAKYAFYNRTVISLLRKTLGLERANFFPTAGAAVSPEVERFVHAAGLKMLVGYGLTESTATVSCDVPELGVTMGSVGRLVDGLELKIGENNEILLRGKTITPGYYRKEAETREAIDEEGWFHTGDAGYMKDGELYLTERIKDLFKTSNGKYIAPQMIESKLVLDRFIEQAVIVANERKFVSALIVPDFKVLEAYAEENNIERLTREDLCNHPAIKEMIAERIAIIQSDLAHYEKIKKFTLLPKGFTIEGGELTNTLKVKRHVVYDRYAKEVDLMYAE